MFGSVRSRQQSTTCTFPKLPQAAHEHSGVPYRDYELGHTQGLGKLSMLARLPTTLKSSLKLCLEKPAHFLSTCEAMQGCI